MKAIEKNPFIHMELKEGIWSIVISTGDQTLSAGTFFGVLENCMLQFIKMAKMPNKEAIEIIDIMSNNFIKKLPKE